MTAFVRAASLSNYAEVASQVGLDANAMLRRAGIDRRALTDLDLRLPAARVAELLERSAAESGCETFGLRMAESRRISDFGAISLLITHQATLRDALMTVVSHRQLLNESLLVQVEEHDGLVIIREELLVGGEAAVRPSPIDQSPIRQAPIPQSPIRQSYELAIGVLFRMFRTLLGARWRAESINFTHRPPADLTVHRRMFGPIVQFGSDFNGLTCASSDLDAPNPTADPALAEFAARYVQSLPGAEHRSLSDETQKAIYLLLPTGQASIGRVAASLGLNDRTLQRRLLAEGGDFSRLLNDIRRELAVRYVAGGDFPLARIAGLVGYSRQTSFNRWFAAEFGASPTRWRGAAAGG